MADTQANTPSLTDRVRPVDAGAPVIAIHFLGPTAAFVLGEEALFLATTQGEERRIAVHDGGILAAAGDGKRVITGGDDGKVVVTDVDGATQLIATDAKRRWIDHVAAGPDGAVAWSAGKTAFVRPAKGEVRSLDVVSTVGGLAFAPKGFRLAIAHYNGVSLWFPKAQAAPEMLEWKGSHLGVLFSVDGKFLISTMQEPMLHGWRLPEQNHMRMSGYSARVRSLSFSADGEWLATSGSEQLILWPFQSKTGPMGKQPQMLAPTGARVTAVACHPKQGVVAVGHADGLVLLVRIDDAAEILAKRPGGAAVSALAWDAAGSTLAFGSEDGEAGLLPL
ncbi:MAG: WD40 repeat domain-containing protein [Xanthobacteraceae bacterium]